MTANTPAPVPPIGPAPTQGGGQPPNQASRFKPVDPLRVVRQYIVLLVVAGILGVGVGVGTYLLLRNYNPTYTSSAALYADPDSRQLENVQVNQVGEHRNEVLTRYINTEINRLLQERVLRTALQRDSVADTRFIQRMKEKGASQGENWINLATTAFKEGVINARQVPNTALLEVRVGTKYPEDAPRLLQAVIDVYMNRVERSTSDRFGNLQTVFVQERERAASEVERLQEKRSNFRQENNISTLKATHNEAGIQYRNAAEERARLQATLAQLKSTYQSLRQQQAQGTLQPTPSELQELERLQPIQRRIERLAALREELAVREERYGEEHRMTREVENRIDAVQAEKKQLQNQLLRKRRSAQISQARQNIETVKAQLEERRQALESASVRLTELGDKLNRFKAIEEQLETARKRVQRAQEALTTLRMKRGPGSQPMKLRNAPTKAELTSPNPITTVGGVSVLLFGLVTGLVFLRELLDQRLRSPADVALVPDAETLGVLPSADEDPSSGRHKIEGVVERHPGGLMAECFRQLRTAILSKMDRRGYRTLVLAGTQPGSGASSVTQNLAASLSHNGRRVLVLDCDFRRPRQHTLAALDNSHGLVDVLRGEATLESVVQPIEGTHMAVVPTGQAEHAQPELLESQAFRTVLSQMESEYDIVLLDAPPALLTSDCRMLAKLVDAMAVVVRADRDKRGMVGRLLRQLQGQRADMLGVILNGVQSAAGGYFRKSYEAFYKYAANGDNGTTGRRSSRRITSRAKKSKQTPAEP